MTSPEKNEPIKCINCELYKKEIQEKDNKIKILENNLLKIKSLLSESGSLIDGYNEIMEENKQLKNEIERLKDNINKTSNDNYQFDLLKGKMLRFQKENEKLRSSIQFYESQKNQNLNIKNSNEIKIKRELSLKDKEINQLNTIISLLKLKHNEQNISNEEIIKNFNKGNGDNIIDQDELYFLDNNKNNNNINNDFTTENDYRSNINTNNNIKMKDIFEEKEFLSEEYQKYKQKYIIYKFKYHEFKKTTKLFLNTMKIIPPGNNILNSLELFNEGNNNIKLIGNKRNKDKEEINLFNNINSIRNKSKVKKNSDKNFKSLLKLPSLEEESDKNSKKVQDKDESFDINESENEEKNESGSHKIKSKIIVKKEKTKKIKKEKSENSINSNSESKEKVNNKNKDNKIKTESKKRGRKPKKEKEKENLNQNTDIKKEKDKIEDNKISEKEIGKENGKTFQKVVLNQIKKDKDLNNENNDEILDKIKDGEEINDEKNKPIEKKIIEEFKGPIPKNINKKIDPLAERALKANMLLNLLSNNPEKITEENINIILSLQETLHEKISFLFETMISNLIQLELSRVLTLFEVFIDSIQEDSKTLIGFNILENINLHLNSNSLLNKKIHLKFANKANETYKTYITKNFSSPIFIVSFLIDILYRKLTDISCISNFIFKLVFDKNIDEKNKSKILIILTNTLKENNYINKLYYKEEQYNRFISKENENKFYFFLFYKSTLITDRIFYFILSIYPHDSSQEEIIDSEIISKFNDIFNSIPEEEELKIQIPNFPEEYKSSIKFNSNLFYLELFQALYIIVETKDIKWIAENIFTNILWKNFQNSKKDSLKRALSIYYTSLLFYLCLKAGIKNHGSENLLEQIEFSRIYGWLYSIYNPQIQFENFIGFYERICALSWIVESPIITMSTKVVDSIKEVVAKIINGEKENLCPSDFLEKIKKLKLI